MLLMTLGKIVTILVIGGGGVATYYFVNNSQTVSHSEKTSSKKRVVEGLCSKPFIMKSTGGIAISFNSEQEGLDFLRDYYQGQGTVEKCPDYKEPK